MKLFLKTFLKKEICGSYICESAVIVPLLLCILLQLVLLGFYMHDTVSAKNVSYRYLIDYSMKSPNNLNLQSLYYKEKILDDNISFSFDSTENNLRISSNIYTSPVTFTNYNNTHLLRNFVAAQKRKKENL